MSSTFDDEFEMISFRIQKKQEEIERETVKMFIVNL